VVLNVGQHTATKGTAESYRQNLQHGPTINKALECASKKVRFVWYAVFFFGGAQRGIFLTSLLMFCRRTGRAMWANTMPLIRNGGFTRGQLLAGIRTGAPSLGSRCSTTSPISASRLLAYRYSLSGTWRCHS
jgi:hypothetical protein